MKKTIQMGILIAALLLVVFALPLFSIVPLVEGEVTDEKGNPLSAVRIRNNKNADVVYSDNEGHFKLEAASDTRMYLFKKGYLLGFFYSEEPSVGVKITLDKKNKDLEISLPPDKKDYRITKILLDSINVPKDEWNSLNPKYIQNVAASFFPSNKEAHFAIYY